MNGRSSLLGALLVAGAASLATSLTARAAPLAAPLTAERLKGGAAPLAAPLTAERLKVVAAPPAAPPAAESLKVVAAPPAQIACADTDITAPQAGAMLEGTVAIFGSARIDNFNFYKLEYAQAFNPDVWSAVSETKSAPVLNGILDVWDTTRIVDGEYFLKLTVVDPIGQEVCRYTKRDLYVANMGTPTPTETATPEESPTPTLTPEFTAPDDRPTEMATPVPTVAPIVPVTNSNDPLSTDALDEIFGSFLRGFGAALVAAMVGLALVGLRRR